MERRSKSILAGFSRLFAQADNIAATGKSQTKLARILLPFSICVFLALAVWVVFGQTRHFEFVNYDDNKWVYENPLVSQRGSMKGVLLAFSEVHVQEWYPLTTLSHMLVGRFWGLNPGAHHVANVVLHAATAMLLFLALRKMTGALWRSAFVAAVFAIHPLRVESVAWVMERKDVLSGLFFMLTLWAYAAYAQRRRASCSKCPPEYSVSFFCCPWYWLALVCFTLGLLSKTMLVTLPCVLLLLDHWPLGRTTLPGSAPVWRRLVVEKLPFLLLSAAGSVITILTAVAAIAGAQPTSMLARIGNALTAYANYIGQMLYPVGLEVLYPYHDYHAPLGIIAISSVVLCVISLGVVAGMQRFQYLTVGWLWYLGMLVPVIGLLQAGTHAHSHRCTYLPQIGLYVMIAWGMADLCRKWPRRRIFLGVVTMTVLSCLLLLARIQTSYWRNSLTLWTKAIESEPRNCIALNNLGTALHAIDRINEAIPYYEHALRISPDYKDAHVNIGVALYTLKKPDQAISHFNKALQTGTASAKDHRNLGAALDAIGETEESIRHYKLALEINPDYADAHNSLGLPLARQGKLDEARQHFEIALKLATGQNQQALAEQIRSRLALLPPAPPP
jgi:Tfp pilus assembly protein PilF